MKVSKKKEKKEKKEKRELTPIEKAHETMRKRRESGEVIKKLNPIERAKKKPTSLRLAINAKCYDCMCFQKKEITLCPSKDCPLYFVRPYQKSIDTGDDE